LNNYTHIFKPLKVGNMTVKNRIETAPCMPFLGTGDCDVSRELIEWERALAKGGAGIVTIGDSPVVSDIARHVGHILDLGSDKTINGLNKLAEAIQRYGAKASIELTYLDFRTIRTPMTMTQEDIKSVIDAFAMAAFRAMNAGLDMIMIHGAHGHLISQFLSAKKNQRTDAYGGSFENRARLVLQMLDAIRDKVGNRLAIEYRISADELAPDGIRLEEQMAFAKMIQDRIDLAHISVGNLFVPELSSLMIQPTYVPRGINVHYAETYKKALKIPVTALGSINLPMAEQIIAENKADMVAMNRGLLADPESINKVKRGEESAIRPCVRCNTCINRTHHFYIPIRCVVNPLNGRESEFSGLPPIKVQRKVVVVGGGPAGMEAARRAAGRGHRVVLMEKENRLGGTIIAASAAPFKADMKDYLAWAVRTTLDTPNLEVRLSTPATPEKIKNERPDVLIIAAGSTPLIPRLPGIDGPNVVWAGDADLGTVKIGKSVVVAGAGLTGSETALNLAQQGKKVTLIDMLSPEQINVNAPFIGVRTVWDMLQKLNTAIITSVKLEAVTSTGAVITCQDGKKQEIPCETLVLALGVEPRADVVKSLDGLAPEVFVIGDCHNRRGNLASAVSEGFFAAMDIS
jgi:2,4-dienoyl-CoA reductase-like NADH-dependent reductase (Old Yellow Enzyme family)/NADPH-dependent 2,4-dienoyl-CoA reductase/sulfur reductase-like enzyme